MSKLREEFEKFYRSHMTKEGQENVIINSTLNSYKNERDKYGYSDIQEMWLTWKASRESLCIELPKKQEFKQYDMDFVRMPAAGRNKVIDEFVEILEKAGVNYK